MFEVNNPTNVFECLQASSGIVHAVYSVIQIIALGYQVSKSAPSLKFAVLHSAAPAHQEDLKSTHILSCLLVVLPTRQCT